MKSQPNFWYSPIAELTKAECSDPESVYEQTQRSKWLAGTLLSCRDVHKRAAPGIVAALDQLIEQVQSEKIAIADSKSRPFFYGQRYIISSISELFGPPLDALVPSGSNYYEVFISVDDIFPLKKYLSTKNSCRRVADSLEVVSKKIKSFSVWSDHESLLIRESIHCLKSVLDAVHNVLPVEPIDWCAFCFRRSSFGSDYCRVHRPMNDTDYRIGRRINGALSKDTLEHWNRYRSLRRALKESFFLVSSNNYLTLNYLHLPSVNVSDQVALLVGKTPSEWLLMRTVWHEIIIKDLTSLLTKIGSASPLAYRSWEEWVSSLKEAFQDEDEKTSNPFWILNILCCADEWFSVESNMKDTRRTDTREKIRKLWDAGKTNVSDIARELNISRQTVNKVVKDLKRS